MSELIKLLTESGVPEASAKEADDIIQQKLQEGIEAGVAAGIQEAVAAAQISWVMNQAPEMQSFVESAVAEWTKENAVALDESVKTQAITEATAFLQTIVGKQIGAGSGEAPADTALVESLQQNIQDSASLLESTNQKVVQLQAAVVLSTQLVEGKEAEITGLQTKLDEAAILVAKYEKADAFRTITEGLSTHKVVKIEETLEGMSFNDLESYKSAVQKLAESYKKSSPNYDPAADLLAESTNGGGATLTNNSGTKPLTLMEATLLQMQGKKA